MHSATSLLCRSWNVWLIGEFLKAMSQPEYQKVSARSSSGVTIIDVAREAGVSYTTVSRVINDKDNVRPDKRERVLAAMSRLGYVVNQHARTLAGGRSQIIGMIVHDLGTNYVAEIVRGIETALDSTSYDLMLYTTHRRPGRESSHIIQMSNGMVDGLLLFSPRANEDALSALNQRGVPHVIIDNRDRTSQHSTISVTNWQGAFEATNYLVSLGHRRIGFITGALDTDCSHERLSGYKAALDAAGLAVDAALVREGNFQRQPGYRCACELLSLHERPTAIFASNDVSAFGALEAIRDHGLRVPDDISLVGFDDIPPAAHLHPALTTVRQPLQRMGERAMEMLLRVIEGRQSAIVHAELPTELVVRRSCQALA